MNKIPSIIKRNFFDESDLDLIWNEIQFLNNDYLMNDPIHTGTATDENGTPKKSNKGIFVSQLYKDYNYSSIWRASRKIFNGITEEFSKLHFCTRSVLSTNQSDILYSYYENGGYYAPHEDSCITTVLYWFCKKPKKFSGGNLIFNDTEEVIKFEHNTMVMFPSWAKHSVTEVIMEDEDMGKNLGRHCFTHFLNISYQ